MDEHFDPYHKWLGIPPEDQPPHHYRLLGIEPFEPDPDVIANAADGRMAQVKNFQIGKYSERSQQILNEISAAKLCLLNLEKKESYDRKLRPRLEAEKVGIPNAAAPAVRKAKPKTDTTVETEMPAIETSSVFSYVSARNPKRQPWLIWIVFGGGAVGLVALSIFLVFFLGRGNGSSVARQPAPQKTPREDFPPQGVPVAPPSDPDGQNDPPAVPETDPHQPPVDPPTDPDITRPREADPGRLLAALLDPPDPGQPGHPATGVPVPETLSADQPSGSGATVVKTLPVPDDDAKQKAEQRIRGLFRKEFAAATTPDSKSALARKLSSRAEETTDDPTVRFVLMQLACETGAAAGELTMTLEVADRMRQLYGIDALTFKASLLEKVSEAVGTRSATSATNQHLLDAALMLVDEAVVAGSLDLAGRLMSMALSTARKMQDPGLVRRLTARNREIDRMKVRFIAVRNALDVLAEDPDDGQANLTAGRWYCFSGRNWAKGLPLLAKGADAELAKLAEQDLAGPGDPKGQIKLADLWWDLAKKEKGPDQRGIQARAGHWYELALPGLSGLDRMKAEKRMVALAAAAGSTSAGPRGVVQKGNVALASNGTTVSGDILQAAELLDGKTETIYERGKGYAFRAWPCEWVITFDKVYLLREIRLKLLDKTPAYHNYTIEVSADGEEFTMLADRSKGQWSSWQRVTFPPRPVKHVKFKGLYKSSDKSFAVIEFEAYCIPAGMPRR